MTLTFDLLTSRSCRVMSLGWSIPIPSLKWIWLTVPELTTAILHCQLKDPVFTFFGVQGVRFKIHLFNPQKAVPWPARHIMTYCAWVYVQRCDLWPRWSSKQKRKKLSCVKLAICQDHPPRYSPLKLCMRGRVWEVVIHFKFHENRLRGLGAVVGRKSPSPIDLAHGFYNSL